MTVFSGAPLRFRLYTAWGLSAVEIATLLAFNSVSFWLGMISAAGVSFTIAGGVVPSGVHLPVGPLRPLGRVLLLVPIGYLALCALRRTRSTSAAGSCSCHRFAWRPRSGSPAWTGPRPRRSSTPCCRPEPGATSPTS